MSDQSLIPTETCNPQMTSENGTSADQTNGPVFRPHVDIVESNEAITLTADMPGVDENHVDLSIEKDVLTIRGTVTPPDWSDYKNGYTEYRVGNYERAFQLSNQIDRSGIEAKVRQGVLHVRLPKSQHAQTQRVTVQAG
ncbi:Hsp20/alpha crystallin family protein [Thalassoroseus pseudoceratinae]|uniref:Hsp20/alpha crystallin family protein n=1 Tax=Thalassoroseus pseudoceratinae TaxID=2713176 RepID=UPI001422AA65|nr:Hsp20/alpha crystallin family protein [Thalassoroseus pseudoceratinae]